MAMTAAGTRGELIGLAGHRRVRAGVQGGRAVGRGGDRAGGRRGGPAERLAGRGDAGADGAGGLAGLHRGRPGVADAERRGRAAAGRRRRRDRRGHGRRRRPRLHRLGDRAVAGRAGADARGAPGRRVHRARVAPSWGGAGPRAAPRRSGTARWHTGPGRTTWPGPAARSTRSVQQGPFAPRALPRFNATTDPAATVSSSTVFPGPPVMRSTLLRRFLDGTRTASPVAWHVLVTVLSLPPRQREVPHQIVWRHILLPSSDTSLSLNSSFLGFRGRLSNGIEPAPERSERTP